MIERGKKYSILSSIHICMRCSAVSSGAAILLYFLQGFTAALLTLSTGAFIDTSIELLESGDYRSVLYPLLMIILLISYDWISGQLLNLLMLRIQIAVREKFCTEVTAKISQLNYKYVENQDTWNLITKISNNTDESILNSFQSLLAFVSLIQKILGLFLVLFRYAPLSAVAVIVCSAPLVYLSLAGGRASYSSISETQAYRRRYEYISGLLCGRASAEERVLFGYSDYLNRAWEQAYETWRTINAKVNIGHFLKAKASSIFLVFIAIIMMFVLIPETINQRITAGIFMALVSNIFALVQLMSWSLINSVSEIAKYNEFFHDIGAFSKWDFLENGQRSGEPVDFSSLEFRNVSFAYPGTDKKILDNVSFQIICGRSYAFVGANGSGKTTIMKLMAGLYDNYEGQILINGTDVREWEPGRIEAFFSIVYQDFARFGLTFYENIAIGDVEKLTGDGIDHGRFSEVIHMMELDDVIHKLKNGIETSLGKVKRDSEDLSGGQWQRTAIARCLVNERPVKILDEPTAALDPLAESALYEKFQAINRNHTSITISHRLASAKTTDIIFVIDRGRILGEGSHEFLYENNGLYREMYDSQRSWYSK